MVSMQPDNHDMSPNVVERCFSTTLREALALEDFVPRMSAYEGIVDVQVDIKHARVKIRYDLSCLDYIGVQKLLEGLGVPVDSTVCCRWRSERIARMDQEMYALATKDADLNEASQLSEHDMGR